MELITIAYGNQRDTAKYHADVLIKKDGKIHESIKHLNLREYALSSDTFALEVTQWDDFIAIINESVSNPLAYDYEPVFREVTNTIKKRR